MKFSKKHSEQMEIGGLETFVGFGLAVMGGALMPDPEYTSVAVMGVTATVGGGVLIVDSVRRFNNVIKDLYGKLEETHKKYIEEKYGVPFPEAEKEE